MLPSRCDAARSLRAACRVSLLAALGLGCTTGGGSPDAAFDAALDAFPDARTDADGDAGPDLCACLPGPHTSRIYLMQQEGEVWTFDPATSVAEFVAGPVCDGLSPYSMAVDAQGRAHILDSDSLSIRVLDLQDPGPCAASSYLRQDLRYGLFGMSFSTESAENTCADLYALTYSGDGPFAEGEGLGRLGAIDAASGDLRDIAAIDFDGGELTGTGDGRLFALAGVDPVKLVEYDKATGAVIEQIPLEGFSKTNASAIAFFGGDLYIFIEAWPEGCVSCLTTGCPDEYAACIDDEVCSAELACAIESADLRDDCGGLLPTEMVRCLEGCLDTCFTPPRVRVSQVLRFDLDQSDGPERALTRVTDRLPIRVVGAASSPCVPVGPI